MLDLRFPIGRRAPFRAGQFLEVRLPGAEPRPYSLANPRSTTTPRSCTSARSPAASSPI
ncbi:hypothetical protein ACFQV8_37990 [Pseudonocardia benzenivorans]